MCPAHRRKNPTSISETVTLSSEALAAGTNKQQQREQEMARARTAGYRALSQFESGQSLRLPDAAQRSATGPARREATAENRESN